MDTEPVAGLQVPQEAVEAAGLALGKALAAATYVDGGEEGVDWAEWHKCEACPTSGPCGCAGTPFAKPELTLAALSAAAPVLLAFHLRGVADEMRDARSWLAERHLSDSPGPGLLLATVRASLYATADRLHPPTPDTREGIPAAAGLTEADMEPGKIERCYMGHASTGPDGCQGACDA